MSHAPDIEPTKAQIEAVCVAMVDAELAKRGKNAAYRQLAKMTARDIAVAQFEAHARAAIIAYERVR